MGCHQPESNRKFLRLIRGPAPMCKIPSRYHRCLYCTLSHSNQDVNSNNPFLNTNKQTNKRKTDIEMLTIRLACVSHFFTLLNFIETLIKRHIFLELFGIFYLLLLGQAAKGFFFFLFFQLEAAVVIHWSSSYNSG